jgi:choline dehydrogenase-like flavoprotein
MAERYDVLIIGSGAGGGTLANRLAPTGKKILILERGDWLPREARNWSVEEVVTRHLGVRIRNSVREKDVLPDKIIE